MLLNRNYRPPFHSIHRFTRAMLLRVMIQKLRAKWKLFAEAWESVQVELHGSYSTARVLELANFARTSNWFRDIAILVGIPLPCVMVTVMIDIFPLAKPSDSIEANTMSFVRTFYSFVIFSLVATHQVRTIMPPQPFSAFRGLLNSLIVSAITIAVLYGLTRAIGFPLPFSIMTVSPAWVVLVAIFVLGEWAKQIRSNRKNQQAVIDLIKLWICDALMVFIYPAFFYIFTTLSVVGQRIFALLLPVIKLLLRNLFARVTVDLSDATPEFVVFHAEVFNSLFMSYCMQTSPSVWTTLQITFADALLTIISLRDIENARRGLRNLELRIDRKHGWGSFHSSVQTGKYLKHTTLDRASKLLQLDENNESTRVSSVADLLRIASYREVVPKKEQSSRTLTILEKTVVIPNKVGPTGGSVHPDGNHELARNGSSQASITLRYTCKVRRLLYMAEFLILLNYVEVFIPMVFSINTLATYYLPNREYYPVFKGMDESRLAQTLQNVMFYCFLQIVSLALLINTLKRMLGFSPTHQLVFVLERQFHRVHSSVVFWVFYNVQASLQHSGYDYSFHFTWLKAQPESTASQGV